MSNDIQQVDGKDLYTFAQQAAKTKIIPKAFQNQPDDLYIALITGMEMGLKPMQSLKSIAVVNGTPTLWGDALVALVQKSESFEDMKTGFDEKTQSGYAIVKRKGQSEHESYFSMEDAKKASLLNKGGAWATYPKRMCMLRARAFALRDVFADVLGGIQVAEEVQDYGAEKPESKFKSKLERTDAVVEASSNIEYDKLDSEVSDSESLEFALTREIEVKQIPNTELEKIYAKKEIQSLAELSDDDKKKLLEYFREKF